MSTGSFQRYCNFLSKIVQEAPAGSPSTLTNRQYLETVDPRCQDGASSGSPRKKLAPSMRSFMSPDSTTEKDVHLSPTSDSVASKNSGSTCSKITHKDAFPFHSMKMDLASSHSMDFIYYLATAGRFGLDEANKISYVIGWQHPLITEMRSTGKISLDMLERLMHNADMNKLSREKQGQIISCLVEGNSLRSITRICDVSINTVTKLLVELGSACADYQDRTLRNLKCKRIQCDEIWSFCYAKAKNVPVDKRGKFGFGDIWTWVAIDADTKLVASFMVGNRDLRTARIFVDDLRSRLANRIQLTTDGLRVYLDAVEGAFGSDVDYGVLVKLYESTQEETRYSPAVCVSAEAKVIQGKPDPSHISTSYVERQNLTMRMQMRRFTRLTNGFSKKVENHAYHVALHYMHYNFCRIHKTLRVTPAMEAGISDHVWTIQEVVALLDR